MHPGALLAPPIFTWTVLEQNAIASLGIVLDYRAAPPCRESTKRAQANSLKKHMANL